MRQRMFDGKTWYPHTLLSLNFFQTRNFRNTKWFRDEVFRHHETKKSDGRTRWPSIMHKIFPNPNFLETKNGSPTMFFGTVRLKIFDWKSWYPPLLSMSFFQKRNFLRLKEVPHKDFRYCDTEYFLSDNRDNPQLIIQFFSTPNFPNQKRAPPRCFSALWDWKFRWKIVISPIIHKNFRKPKFSETQKGFPTIVLGTVRLKIFDRKLWHSLPPSSFP